MASDVSGENSLPSSTYVPPPAPPPYIAESTEFSHSYSNAVTRQDTGLC